MFDEYVSMTGRKKTYLVFNPRTNAAVAMNEAKKRFKCTEDHITFSKCWILKDELYLEDPFNPKARCMFVAIYHR